MNSANQLSGILLFFFFVATTNKSVAQKKGYNQPDEEYRFSLWCNTGLGSIFGDEGGLAGSASVQFQFKTTYLQAQVAGITGLGLFGADYNSAFDISLLYGVSFRENRWKFSGAAGAGFYKFSVNDNIGGGGLFDPPGSTAVYKTTSRSTIGFPLTGSIIYHPQSFGIGLQVNGNINKIKSYGAVGIAYTFRF